MQSQGRPACFAMLVSSDTLPLESGAITYRFFNRVNPSTESGQGSSRCHTRFKCTFSSSESPVILKRPSRSSSTIRCSVSSLVHGSSPFLTRSIDGPYPPRQASANALQSTVRPFFLPSCVPSAITDDRQSTTVPNVSNTSTCAARPAAGASWALGDAPTNTAGHPPSAAAPTRNLRRSMSLLLLVVYTRQTPMSSFHNCGCSR